MDPISIVLLTAVLSIVAGIALGALIWAIMEWRT